MANVAFTLERRDDTAVKLYQKQGTAEYSLLSSSTNRDCDAIDGDAIRTGANGVIFLQLPAGSDTLKEQTTKGCEEISGINLTVGDDGAVTSATVYEGSGNAADDVLGGVGTSRLAVNNIAKRLITLTAQKVRDNTPTPSPSPSVSPSETPSPSAAPSPLQGEGPIPSQEPSPTQLQPVVPVTGPTPPKTGDAQANVGRRMLFTALSAAALAAILLIDKRTSEKR